jgi:hypothetical protein
VLVKHSDVAARKFMTNLSFTLQCCLQAYVYNMRGSNTRSATTLVNYKHIYMYTSPPFSMAEQPNIGLWPPDMYIW